jgi:hypothetical protein
LVGVEVEEFLELAAEVGLLVELGWLGCLAGVRHFEVDLSVLIYNIIIFGDIFSERMKY